mmetsp:Transcript_24829/g.29960  ORF Transcript_24829/g.29960 Transcript_24829/m.29960 type:complete len:91 (+) Transcript_24829:292-564(+)
MVLLSCRSFGNFIVPFVLGTGAGRDTVINKVMEEDGPEGATDIAVVSVILIDVGFIIAVKGTKISVKTDPEVFQEDYKDVVVEGKILNLG